MKPRVSIVINNFNYARYLEQAIGSALSQTWENIEVIVVDDGSTDNSRKIIERYKEQCTVILKANGGQASAFNAGLRMVRGEYLLILDSDDYLYPRAIETFIEQFPENGARVYCRARLVDGDGKDIVVTAAEMKRYYRDFEGDLFEHVRLGGDFFWSPTSTNIIRADVVKAIGEIPEEDFRISADAYLLVNASLHGAVKSIDTELVAYRIHSNNNFASRTQSYNDAKQLARSIDDYYRRRILFARPCQLKGVTDPTLPEWKDYELLKCLCVALRLGVQSPHLEHWRRLSLAGLVMRYLRYGRLGFRRCIQAAFLFLILLLPKPIMLKLVSSRDNSATVEQPHSLVERTV